MNHYISRGMAFNLSSIGVNFINNYLDTIKGIERSESIINEKSKTNLEKSEALSELVIKFNLDLKDNYKKAEWEVIEKTIKDNLYKMISKNELILKDRVI